MASWLEATLPHSLTPALRWVYAWEDGRQSGPNQAEPGRTRPMCERWGSSMALLRTEQPPCVALGTTNEYFSSVFDLCQLVHFGPGHVTGWGFGSRGYVRCWAGQGPGGTSLRSPRPNGHSGGDWRAPGGVFLTKLHVDFTQSRRNVHFLAGVAMFGRSRPVRQVLAAVEVHGGHM